MFGDSFDLAGDELCRDVFDLPRGAAAVNGARFDFRAFEDHRAGGDYRVLADLGVVHDDSAHADEDLVVEGASVYNGIVAYRNVVTDVYAGLFVGTVEDHAVLDIHPLADKYAIDIASYDGIEPDATFVTYFYVSDDRGVRSNEAILSKAGRFAFNRKYRSHK